MQALSSTVCVLTRTFEPDRPSSDRFAANTRVKFGFFQAISSIYRASRPWAPSVAIIPAAASVKADPSLPIPLRFRIMRSPPEGLEQEPERQLAGPRLSA